MLLGLKLLHFNTVFHALLISSFTGPVQNYISHIDLFLIISDSCPFTEVQNNHRGILIYSGDYHDPLFLTSMDTMQFLKNMTFIFLMHCSILMIIKAVELLIS